MESKMTTQIQAEMKRIRDLLPTELFEGSKDWREGNTVERIEWLLSMYESAKQEVERLDDVVDSLQSGLDAAVQYNFDRT
jgi:hypothetical protein